MNKFCTSCGQPATSNTKFCTHCGASKTGQSVAPIQPPAPNPFAPYGGQPVLLPEFQETLLLREMTPNQQIYFMSEMAKVRKNPNVAFWWAFWLGGVGAQHFYLGKTGRGVLYLCFFWTAVPVIVSFVELFTIKNEVRYMNQRAAVQIAGRVKALIGA
jgi:TM2 domain-containing membrane protein YozV